jgi:hypothetical protein
VIYPRVYIAQDFIDPPPWDGRGDPPSLEDSLWDRTGDAPPFGRAYGHVDPSPDADALGEEEEWDDIEDAIAWGRERAQVVLVRIGYSGYYSAGEVRDPDFKPWPPTEEAIRGEKRRGT